MMEVINKVINGLALWLRFFYSVLRLILTENLKDYGKVMRKVINKKHDEISLFANGPSLKKETEDLDLAEFKDKDFGMVNFMANDESYTALRPCLYALSDEQFFIDNHPKSQEAKAMLHHMNDITTWKMLLVIPYNRYKSSRIQSILTNSNITVVPFHHYAILGPKRLRFWFYKHGLGNGEFGTVTQNAIYSALTIGYAKVHLYGVDHNFFDGLQLDKNNNLCQLYMHNYENKAEPDLRKIQYLDGSPKLVHTFLSEYSLLFYGHWFLREYADYMGAEILNHTKVSLIDAYKKV